MVLTTHYSLDVFKLKQKLIAHESIHGEKLEVGSDRSFGIVMGVAFSLLAILIPWKWHLPHLRWLGVAAFLFFLFAFLRPALLHPLNVAWMKFAFVLHQIISPVILGLIFYLAVTPTSWFIRLSCKDPLRLKRRPDQDSYWLPRGSGGTDLNRQF